MAINYHYNWAIIDRASGMCMEVRTSTNDYSGDSNEYELYVAVPTYTEEYLMKYYDEATGKWYHDAEMTNEWIPPQE